MHRAENLMCGRPLARHLMRVRSVTCSSAASWREVRSGCVVGLMGLVGVQGDLQTLPKHPQPARVAFAFPKPLNHRHLRCALKIVKNKSRFPGLIT